MKDWIKNYLSFTRKEQRGILLLLAMLVALLFINPWIPMLFQRNNEPDEAFMKQVKAFLEQMDSVTHAQEGGATQPFPHSSKTGNRQPASNSKRFAINSGATLSHDTQTGANHPSSITNPWNSEGIPEERDSVLIELNSADTADLMALRGIGRYYAGKIIRYRDRLGGFISPEQLMEIEGVDSARFCGLRGQVWTDSLLVRKFNLNMTPFKDYLRHPYFEYHLVKAIFRYKDEHKIFRSVGELRSIPLITPPVFERIKPYLEAYSPN